MSNSATFASAIGGTNHTGGFREGLGSGYHNAHAQHNVQELRSNRLTKIRHYAGDWVGDIRGGVAAYVREYLKERNALTSGTLVETKGPGVTNQDLHKNVIVALLTITNGLRLNNSQSINLQLFRSLLTDTLRPESLPQAAAKFISRYTTYEQSIAQVGNVHTTPGGNAATTHEIVIELIQRTAGVSFGDISLFHENNPEDVVTMIVEKLMQLETTWDLTMLVDHGEYCSRQLGLGETLVLNGNIEEGSPLGGLVNAVQVENLIFGAANRKPTNIPSLVAAALKELHMEGDEAVAIIPKSVMNAMNEKSGLVPIVTSLPENKIFKYSINHPNGMSGQCYIGSVSSDVEADALKSSIGTTELSHRKRLSDEQQLLGLTLSGGNKVAVIPLDDTCLSDNTGFKVQDVLSNAGVKRLSFTVGVPAPITKDLCSSGFFNGDMMITPGMVAAKSPDTTTIIDMNNGQRTHQIKLVELHQVANEEFMFNANDYVNRLRDLDRETIARFSEEDGADMLDLPSWQSKLENEMSIFEASPRVMLVDIQDGARGRENTLAATNNSIIAVIPRTVLGNASPMNDIQADMTNILSGMLMLCPINTELKNYFDMIKSGLSDNSVQGFDDVMAIRNIQPGGDVPDVIMDRFVASGGRCLAASDPYSQLILANYMKRVIRNGPQIINGVVIAHTVADLYQTYNKYVATIELGHMAVTQVFSTLFKNRDFNYLIASESSLIDIPNNLGNRKNRLLKILYGAILPAFTKHVGFQNPYIGVGALPQMVANPDENGIFLPSFQTACFISAISELPEDRISTIFRRVPIVAGLNVNVFRDVFQKRYEIASEYLGFGSYTMVLWMLHMTTGFTLDSVQQHFDRHYPSGMSYLCVRTIKYQGYDIAVMPRKSAHLIVGNMYAGWPTATSVGATYNQVVESTIAPKSLGSMGILLRNVLCTKIQGYGTTLDFSKNDTIITLDCYSGYLPECRTATGSAYDIVPIGGRFDGDAKNETMPDALTGFYTLLPTLNPLLSDAVELIRRYIRVHFMLSDDHSFKLFMDAVGNGDFVSSLPPEFRGITNQTKAGILSNIAHGKATPGPFNGGLAALFSDTYGVGRGSGLTMKTRTGEQSSVDKDLSVIVKGETIVSSFITGEDTAYAAKFSRQTGINIDHVTWINSF